MGTADEFTSRHTGPDSETTASPLEFDGDTDAWSRVADRVYPRLVRALAGITILVLCLWMAAGAINLLVHLLDVYAFGWGAVAERAIVDTLIMLALLEVIRTLRSYLRLGRVRVTFILDTALVVLIGELMGLWFKEQAAEKVLLGLGRYRLTGRAARCHRAIFAGRADLRASTLGTITGASHRFHQFVT